MALKKQSGGCFCGRVRFEVSFPSRFCSHCHCDHCRRAHAAAYVTYLGFRSRQVQLLAGKSVLMTYRYRYRFREKTVFSYRKFCGRCGTTLFFESTRWPGETHVARAAIPGKADREPALHFYYDRRPRWSRLHDDLPKYGGPTGGRRLR